MYQNHSTETPSRSLIVANCNTLRQLMMGLAMTNPSCLAENDWGVQLYLPDKYCLVFCEGTMQIANLDDPMLPFYMGDMYEELTR